MSDNRTILELARDEMKLRGLAETTKKSYESILCRIIKMSESKLDGQSFRANSHHLLLDLERSGRAQSTIVQARAAIQLALIALEAREEAYKTWRPSRRKTRRRTVVVATQTEVSKLLSATTSTLEKAIITTFVMTGIRKSELLNLNVNNLIRETMEIFIKQGKGCKDRLIPFPVALRNVLVSYYREFRPKEALFINPKTNKRLTSTELQQIWLNLKIKTGLTHLKGLHTLRHYFATEMIRRGTDLTTLQFLLGHAHPMTTMHYLHRTTQMTKKASETMGELIQKAG